MGEQVAAGSKKENDVCESRLQSPSRTDRLNIEVRNVYHPLQREKLLRYTLALPVVREFKTL